ncbi:DUF4430 domain-containing protein [Mycoplasmatota bacterium]|nr:DUF4430 domain-containing protein [Mycoplasmatota bacterium]
MKKLFFTMFFVMFVLVGCNQTNTEPTTEITYENYVTIMVDNKEYSLGFNNDNNTLFDLIESSEIHLEYTETDYGPMITEIGDLNQDEFHWISFTVNDEFANDGLDTITYQDGDVFEFTEEVSNWNQTFSLELLSINEDILEFQVGDYQLLIDQSTINLDKIIVGGEYTMTGQPSSIDDDIVYLNVSDIEANFEYIEIITGQDTYHLFYETDTDMSVFDIISESEIELEYTTSDYGPMITKIGELVQDDFHWIGFTVNDEFANDGLDTITYQDGDVFDFTEEVSNWNQTFSLELLSFNEEILEFQVGDYQLLIDQSTINLDKIIVGGEYTMTGQPSSIDDDIVYLNVSDIEANFEYIEVITGQDTYHLFYETDTDMSVFDIISESEIELEYTTSDYGPMITKIGELVQDDFHWIGFTVNGEYADKGLDTIAYQDGDVFEFTENISNWELSISAEIIEMNQSEVIFQNNKQAFIVKIEDLPENILVSDLHIGFIYELRGLVDTEANETFIVFNPSDLKLDVIKDFTELYNLEIGDIFILQFKVTYVESSSAFGSEIYAEDINGISSTEISGHMKYPSTTDYLFYTIPDGYSLLEDNTYIGRFIYQTNEPSQIPQITLYEVDINGEELENVIVE